MPTPVSPFELARLFFAGISAVSAAIHIWKETRDRRKAAVAFDETFTAIQSSSASRLAAEELITIIPPGVIGDLEGRADQCWSSYRKVLGGEYLPEEVDKATDAVQACVCRELNRIDRLGGKIPPRWHPQWKQFDCASRAKAQFTK